VPQALSRIKGRYPIVVLSNGDPDMLERAKAFHRIDGYKAFELFDQMMCF